MPYGPLTSENRPGGAPLALARKHYMVRTSPFFDGPSHVFLSPNGVPILSLPFHGFTAHRRSSAEYNSLLS